jgi:hypothetical protein
MRGRILGDTVALRLFFLDSFALWYALHAGVENPDSQLLEIIEDCIEDLGWVRGSDFGAGCRVRRASSGDRASRA